MSSDKMKEQNTRPARISAKIGILVVVFLLFCCAVLFTGCVNASVSRSVQDWNSWSVLQQKFSQQTATTLQTIDSHHANFNAGIMSGKPDYSTLRSDLVSDRESLELWKPQLLGLDAAAGRFLTNTSLLNGTPYNTAQRMNSNIDGYLKNMNAARGELVVYCTNLETYLAGGDLDYADDSLISAAETAREKALNYLKQADDALYSLDVDARALEHYQQVI